MKRSDSMRRWAILLLAWLFLSGVLAGLLTCPVIQRNALPLARLLVTWDLQVSDRLASTLPRPPGDDRFVFLAIDDSSLDMGVEDAAIVATSRPLTLMAEPFPWSREVWAEAIERLLDAGARLVVLDLLLAAPREGDDFLREVVTRHPDRVVLASSLAPPASGQGILGLGKLTLPADTILPKSEEEQPPIGFVNFWPDLDGVVRTLRYRETLEAIASLPDNEDSVVHPALSTAILEALGEEVPPTEQRGSFRFRVADSVFDEWRPRPFYEIFWPRTWERNYQSGAFFQDKVVLIGPSAPQFHDIHVTPAGNLPGPQLHLNAANAALHDALIREASPSTNAILIFALGLAAGLTVGLLRRPGTAIALLLVTAISFLLGLRLVLESGLLVSAFGPLVSLLLVGSTGLAIDHARVYRERQLLRRALERRVSAEVMDEILANPSSYLNQLGGVRKQVTVMFSDLRGFTSLSESASPEEMVTRLNAYFDLMVAEIQEERGMVDKFIGDAIMAIWGSVPSLPADRAVEQAVAASLGMIRKLETLNTRWREENEGEEPDAPRWAMGIGIHCGEAITGNIGSERRLELTVIGDAVNLASRLEGTTKRYGVSLVVSDTAASHLLDKEGWLLRPLDRVRVSGRKTPVTLYEPLAAPTSPKTLLAAASPDYTEAFEHYQGRDFAKAADLYGRLQERFPDDVATDLLARRCREFVDSPPPEDWEGAIVLTSK